MAINFIASHVWSLKKNDETDNDDGDKGGGGGGNGGVDRVGKSRNDNDNTRKNIHSLHGGYLCSIFAFGWCGLMFGICGVDENDYFMKNYFSTDTREHT